MESQRPIPLRPVIVVTLMASLAVAMAPWLDGGQSPLAQVLTGGALLLAAALAWMQPEIRRLRWGPLVGLYAAFMVFALLSLLWSANRYSTVLWVSEWLAAGLAFRLAYTLAGEPRGREWLVRLYMGWTGVFSIIAIVMYLVSDYNRLTGTFYWANPAAAFLIPAIVMAVDRYRRSDQWPWGALTVLYGASFVLTDSRAATLALVLAFALYWLVTGRNKTHWIKMLLILGTSIGLAIGLSVVSTFTAHRSANILPGSRFAEAAQGESQSGSDRLYFLRSALEMWWEHPVGGTGAGTYADVHPQYQGRVVSASSSAHNFFAQVLAELGLVGAILLAALLLVLGLGCVWGVIARPVYWPVVAGTGGLLIHFAMDIDVRYPALLVTAAVLMGVVYRQWGEQRQRAGWVWPAVALVGLAPVTALYLSNAAVQRGRAAQDDADIALAADDFAEAQRWRLYNPDAVNAEGIARYTLASMGGPQAQGQARAALELAGRGQRLDPYDGQHWQLEGRVLALQGDLAGAERALQGALARDPYNHPEYALDLATVQQRRGNPAGALRTIAGMVRQYPDSVVGNRASDVTLKTTLAALEALEGNIYLQQGDQARATAAARRALHYDRKSVRARALAHQLGVR